MTCGPVTNLARALEREPAFPRLLKRWVLMGGAYRIHIEVEGPAELENQLSQIPAVVSVRRHGDSGYDLEAASDVRPEVARAVVEAGRRLLAIQNEAPSLDEIYARYFKEVEHVSAA